MSSEVEGKASILQPVSDDEGSCRHTRLYRLWPTYAAPPSPDARKWGGTRGLKPNVAPDTPAQDSKTPSHYCAGCLSCCLICGFYQLSSSALSRSSSTCCSVVSNAPCAVCAFKMTTAAWKLYWPRHFPILADVTFREQSMTKPPDYIQYCSCTRT